MDTFSVTIISRWPIVRERVKVGMYGYHFTSNQIRLKITLKFHLSRIFRRICISLLRARFDI